MKRHPAKADGLVTRRIAGETIIVPIRAGVGDLDAIFTLNETGSAVWGLIDGRAGVAEIARTIAREHEVSPDEAAADVAAFLDALEREGLVRPAPGGQG